MADIRLRVGGLTSMITFAATEAKVGEVVRRFVTNKAAPPPEGSTQAQENQYYLDQALAEIVRTVRQEAIRERIRELRAEQQSLEEQAEQDNEL